MPYKVVKDGDKWCVHKENADKSIGALVPGGCHDTPEEARKHQAALYVNVEDAATSDAVVAPEDDDEDEDVNCDTCEEITKDEALVYASLPAPEFEAVDGELDLDVQGARRYARAVRFTNLAVAKAERNANGDVISVQNLGELAATITDMPVTDKHPGKATPHIIGVHTGGRVVEVKSPDPAEAGFYMLASGVWWSGRHPKVVAELVAGKRKPSIEAQSERTGCNVCGAWFDFPSQYCAHLSAFKSSLRAADNVSRLHQGMRAMGSAAVPNPAGTNTGFHNGRFYMVAEELPVSDEDSGNVEAGALPERTQANMQEDADMKTIEELSARIAELEAQVADVETKLEAKSAELVVAEAKTGEFANEKTLIIARAATLASTGMTADEIVALPIATWDEATFNLIAAGRKPRSEPKQGTTFVADTQDDKKTVTSAYSMFDSIEVKA